MKQRVLSVALALCLCVSSQSVSYALPKDTSQQEEIPEEKSMEEADDDVEKSAAVQKTTLREEDILSKETPDEAAVRNGDIPSPSEAYEAMIALKDQEAYKEGTTWTNEEPYSDAKGYYRWKGGPLDGKNISAVGCVAFAFILSDAAFGSLPARMYSSGEFSFDDIKVGDILRVNGDAHTVIVLEVSDVGVVVAEGNISTGDHKGKVHWGRGISKEEVMRDTSHYITRYPENYVPPEDPGANESIADGSLGSGLAWKLTKAGTLTISGKGAMPDFDKAADQPWSNYAGKIRKVVIEDGVTGIGSGAFWDCGVISAEFSAGVTTIGSNAFRGSQMISAVIPGSVKTIGNSAFRDCKNLSSVKISEGMETIGSNAFRACTALDAIALPASISEVGDAAFMDCTEMKSAAFASGGRQVKMGDNVFTQCYKLMRVTLPERIDRIGEGMFQNCLMLAGVEIPRGAESIGGSAFASCSGLTTIIIPDSVSTIGIAAFSACPLKDIYFTGTEAQWRSISKLGDTASALAKPTIHYNYTPGTGPSPLPEPGDGDNDNSTGGSSNNNTGSNHNSGGNNRDDSGGYTPKSPEEIKRYACKGKEVIEYIPAGTNVYQIAIENEVQGPLCFEAFEKVLGDYTIGRTYNIYPLSGTAYGMEKEIQVTMKIPSAIYKENREYKMICVTKDGKPILYGDLDSNPETITIKTNKFYAYALIYK